jgi:hypothetical protein
MSRMWLHDLPKGAVFLAGDGDRYSVVIPSAEREHPKAVRAAKVDDPGQVQWFGFLGDYEVEVIS